MSRPEGSFTPGSGIAVVTTRWTALVLGDRDHPSIGQLVALGFGEGPEDISVPVAVETVLDELSRTGFDTLPPLGIVAWDRGTCRLVLRGGVVAEVADETDEAVGAAPVVVDSDGVRTWTEHVLTDAAAVTLCDPAAGFLTPGPSDFWTSGGVVSATRIHCRQNHHQVNPPIVPEVAPAVAPVVTVAPPAPTGPAPAPDDSADPLVDPPGPLSTPPSADEVDEVDEVIEVDESVGNIENVADYGHTLVPPFEPEPNLETDLGTETEPEPEPDSPAGEPEPAFAPGTERPPAPATPTEADESPVESAVDAASDEPSDAHDERADSGVDDGDDSYDHLFGSTIVRSVEGAAVRAGTSTDPTDDSPSDHGPSDHGDPTDHDGLTITVSELRRLRAAEVPATPAAPPPLPAAANPAGEHVARQCQLGHLNPPQATACRVCGRPVDGETFRVDRIELGSFRFSTGRQVPIAGTMLVGRSPKQPGNSAGPIELVEVPSPQQDISRTHVEVRVEGWQVLVIDRGSTNGTVITIPGRQPQRLRAGEPFPLPVGGTVNLADEAEFVYEVDA